MSREDLEDLAGKKSLDLMARAESGEWDPTNRSLGEIVSYLSTTARNGLVSTIEETRRRSWWRRREAGDQGRPVEDPDHLPSPFESPTVLAERREYAETLRDCAQQLATRARKIWFFRVFLNLSTRDIAHHPEVGLMAGHVDVIIHRTRKEISDCLARHGMARQVPPVGTFAELWAMFRSEWGE